MIKFLGLSCLLFVLASCSSTNPSFSSMSEVELVAYNEGRAESEQVYCIDEAEPSTFISKRRCKTVEDWKHHNADTMLMLHALDANR